MSSFKLTAEDISQGMGFDEFADLPDASAHAHASFMREAYSQRELDPGLIEAVEDAVTRHCGRVIVVAFADARCQDTAANLPTVARLCNEVAGMDLRIFQYPDAEDLLGKVVPDGEVRTPLLVFYDRDFNEIGRWHQRPQKATALLEQGIAEVRKAVMDHYAFGLAQESLREFKEVLEG